MIDKVSYFKQSSNIVDVFYEIDNELIMKTKKEDVTICRQIPTILKQYKDIDTGKIFYELSWKENNEETKIVVPAISLAKKGDFLNLSENGFAVNENNYRHLIKYFDRFLAEVKPKKFKMSNRIGFINGKFIHPNLSNDIMIIPDSHGGQQLFDSFQEKGTVDSWKQEVFELIKPFPAGVLTILCSFSSVLMSILDLEPFIYDLSGPTSRGKTTMLKVSGSLWGNFKLIGNWNDTRVNIERRSEFLNCYPLILDDTKKLAEVNPKQLVDILYFYSSGQTKGRGTISGFEGTRTWRNILLSTGESSILEYTGTGGSAARVITNSDHPLMENPSVEFLTQLYKAIDKNYGVIGKEFVKHLNSLNEDEKAKLHVKFDEIRSKFGKLAKGNDVLTRLTTGYSVIYLTGILVNKFFDLDINLNIIVDLFNKNLKENTALDKPKQLLNELLEELDTNRGMIYYNYQPSVFFAVESNGRFLLTPKFVNERLGTESNSTKKEWNRKGYIIPGKDGKVSQPITKDGNSYRLIEINPDIIKELGYDFTQKRPY